MPVKRMLWNGDLMQDTKFSEKI